MIEDKKRVQIYLRGGILEGFNRCMAFYKIDQTKMLSRMVEFYLEKMGFVIYGEPPSDASKNSTSSTAIN